MKIDRICVFRKQLHYARGSYIWGRGNVIESGSSTIVVVETDNGLSGCGKFCPCGDNYMTAHQEGTEAAMKILAPALIGQNPCEVSKIEWLMDNHLRDHGYSNAAMAHLAASTAEDFLTSTTDLHTYNIETTGKPAPRTENGLLFASDLPGHGVEPDYDSLGEPVAVYH